MKITRYLAVAVLAVLSIVGVAFATGSQFGPDLYYDTTTHYWGVLKSTINYPLDVGGDANVDGSLIAQGFKGAGMPGGDCDSGTSKLIWDTTTGAFSCGTDSVGATVEQWHNGSQASNVKHITFNGTTTSGSVVFYLTNDGTSGGSALCTNAPNHINVIANDPSNTFGLGYAVTNSNKTLTITANVRTFSSGNALINLIGGVTNVITNTSMSAAPNGTAISVAVDCN